MTTFKVAVIILVCLCIFGEIVIGWAISDIQENIKVMRTEYLKIIESIHDDSKRYFNEWGTSIEHWKETLDATNVLLEIIKEAKDD